MEERKISKVAFCTKCDSFVMACHVDHLSKKTENNFIKLSNEGFIIKIETAEETRARNWSCGDEYEICKKGECK